MITRYMAAAGVAFTLSVTAAAAQGCGGYYTVQGGDTLSQISDGQYKDARKWSAIYGNNLKSIGENPNAIRVGQKLHLTCIDGLPVGLEGGVAQAAQSPASKPVAAPTGPAIPAVSGKTKRINFLTAGDYKPFHDESLPNGGLLTDIMETAMRNNPDPIDYKIYWVNDWSSHLDPLLTEHFFDLGSTWLQPDCVAEPNQYRCETFHFSDPLFEMLILLFTNKSDPIKFEKDDDILGKTLCRPKSYYTHDLDKNGRNWFKENKIKMKRPVTVKECFELLVAGEVDAVALNEFVGRETIKTMDLGDKVIPVQTRPLSIEGLHLVIHKEHPHAEEMLGIFNNSLDHIKKTGDYQKIIDEHMTRIWENL